MSRKPKGAKPKRAGPGRPTLYTPELGERICERIALRKPLSKICASAGMPCEWTVYRWKLKHTEFAENLARAREHRAEARADRIDDYMELLKAGKLDPHSARVLIDAERWQAGKEAPKRYGDKVMSEVAITAAVYTEPTSASVEWIKKVLAGSDRSNVIQLLPQPPKEPAA